MRKNITLLVDSVIYGEYRKLCKAKGWITSRQFENFMKKQLKKQK